MNSAKKFWAIYSYISPLIASAKCFFIYHSNNQEFYFWVIGTVWITWIIFAFRFNKDLPAVGPFSYENGKNQTGRFIYSLSIPFIFFVALFFYS